MTAENAGDMREIAAAETAQARAARPDEAEAVLEILSLAFGLDQDAARPIFYADPYYDLFCKRVLTRPGTGIVSCLTLVPAQVRIGGVPVAAVGVAGVATRPAFQRRGNAAALLSATLPALRTEIGSPLALLHPISAPFYQRLGWEYVSRQVLWLSAPASLPQYAESSQIRPATERDWPAIHSLHDMLTRSGTGSFQRDSRRRRLLEATASGREALVFEEAGEITGYVVWERHDVLHLLEMLGRTDTARRGLVGFVACQPDALVEWAASPALLEGFGLPAAGLPLAPGVMLRLVDLEAALSAVHPAHYAPILAEYSAALTLHARDTRCPWNTRPLRLTPDGVCPTTPTDGPWLRAGIRILARLYFGDLLPSQAAAENLLGVDSPQTLALADHLFPRREPYVAPLDQF